MIIAKRYAEAFLAYAKENIGFDRGLEELLALKRVVRDNHDMKEFLESKEIAAFEKSGVIDKVFGTFFSEQSIHFLKLLVDKDRIDKLEGIAEYARLTYSHGVEIDALLKTSYPLDTPVIEKLKRALEEKFKKKIHLYVQLDSDLMGGAYVKVGNMVMDGTVKRRFEDLREKLKILKVA